MEVFGSARKRREAHWIHGDDPVVYSPPTCSGPRGLELKPAIYSMLLQVPKERTQWHPCISANGLYPTPSIDAQEAAGVLRKVVRSRNRSRGAVRRDNVPNHASGEGGAPTLHTETQKAYVAGAMC